MDGLEEWATHVRLAQLLPSRSVVIFLFAHGLALVDCGQGQAIECTSLTVRSNKAAWSWPKLAPAEASHGDRISSGAGTNNMELPLR